MSIQDQLKSIEEHLKNGNYSKEQLIDTILKNYQHYAEINEKLSNENAKKEEVIGYMSSRLEAADKKMSELSSANAKNNEKIAELKEELNQEKEKNKKLSINADKRMSPEAKAKVEQIIKKDRAQLAEERLANMSRIRKKRVMGQMKEKYYTRHKENLAAHRKAAATFIQEDVVKKGAEKLVVPVAGKVGGMIRHQQKKIEARRRLSNIKRMKRQRARNEFLGKMNEKKQKATEYFARHKANAAYSVAVKPVEMAQGFMDKMNKIKESYQTRVQEARAEVAADKTKSANKGLSR